MIMRQWDAITILIGANADVITYNAALDSNFALQYKQHAIFSHFTDCLHEWRNEIVETNDFAGRISIYAPVDWHRLRRDHSGD